MRRIILLILAIAVFSAPLTAQNTDTWYLDKPITDIQFAGLLHVDRNELDALVKPYIGKIFTDSLFLELQSIIYEIDYFEKIEPNALPGDKAGTTVIIKFVVEEKPIVDEVRFEGNSGLKNYELLDVVTIKNGDLINKTKIRADEQAIKRLYLEKGFPDVKVKGEEIPIQEGKAIVVKFTIDEGVQVAIRKIVFTGNSAISENALKGAMSLKEQSLFTSGAFEESKLEEDKALIIGYYKERGFVDAEILEVIRSTEKDEKTNKSFLALTINVKEGKQYIYNGITFKGNAIFPTERLKGLVWQKEGSILNAKKLESDLQRVMDLYYENGYVFNSVSITENRDEEKNLLGYMISIVERERAHIENIIIRGNKKTKDYVLYREIPLETGDIFSKTKIFEGLRNLYNLQYFSAITPETPRGSAENLIDLVINVEEQSTADIQFGMTFTGMAATSDFPISGTIKLADRNFLGFGQTFSIGLVASPDEQSLTFSFLENWFAGVRWSGGVDLSLSHTKRTEGQDVLAPLFYDLDVPDPYTSYEEWINSDGIIPSENEMTFDDYGISLGFTTGYKWKTEFGDVGVGTGISSELSYLWYDSTKFRHYQKDVRDVIDVWDLTNKMSARTYIDSLDLSYNPTSGYFASQRFTWTGMFPFELQHYIRSDSKIEAYATLLNLPVVEGYDFKLVLGAHSAFSTLMPQFGLNSFKFNTSDALRIDGMLVARGWSELQTLKYGYTLWDTWIELRTPIPFAEKYIWLDCFLDAVTLLSSNGLLNPSKTSYIDSAKNDFSSLGFENFAFDAGFGLRLTIAQFPFRFYLSKKFTVTDGQVKWMEGDLFKINEIGFTGMDFVVSMTISLY